MLAGLQPTDCALRSTDVALVVSTVAIVWLQVAVVAAASVACQVRVATKGVAAGQIGQGVEDCDGCVPQVSLAVGASKGQAAHAALIGLVGRTGNRWGGGVLHGDICVQKAELPPAICCGPRAGDSLDDVIHGAVCSNGDPVAISWCSRCCRKRRWPCHAHRVGAGVPWTFDGRIRRTSNGWRGGRDRGSSDPGGRMH